MADNDLDLLFAPYVQARLDAMKGGKRLVHYTSAEAGYRIVSGRQVWLRNALLMNDFSEIEHGLNCLRNAWAAECGAQFQAWLDEIQPGAKEKLVELFDQNTVAFRVATFMMSLSEHDDDEDEFGRLSMWRAYGGKNGVALVMNADIFQTETDEIKVYSWPVQYISIASFPDYFALWFENLRANTDKIAKVEQQQLLSYLFYSFRVFVLCTKHPGFHEEKEWRLFHSPLLDGTSKWLRADNEIVNGVPQQIIKVSLEDDEELGVIGADPKRLFNRIIIGPTTSPEPIRHAMYDALVRVGIDDPHSKIWASYIPLRQ